MSLFHPSTETALDSNGDPIPGATWSFFLTGTSTPTSVYSNAALSVSLGAIVTASGAGRFVNIYIDDDVTYRAILKDEDGVTIRDIDPYSNAFNTAESDNVSDTLDDHEARIEALETAALGEIGTVISRAPLGAYALPTSFVDNIGSSIPFKTGNGWRFLHSRVDALDDFSADADVVHYYISYTDGDDGDSGLTNLLPVKNLYTLLNLIDDSADTMFVVHLMDKVHGSDSNISVNSYADLSGKKVRFVAEHESGRCYFIGASLAATYTWTASGSDGAYVSTTAQGQKAWRSVLDANYPDAEGVPSPLTLAASHVAAQTTPNSFFRDATGITVHLRDGRVPDFQDGFILNGDTASTLVRMDSGTVIFENVTFAANDGVTTGGVLKLQYAITADFSSTAKVGFKGCHFIGGNGAGLMAYDFPVMALESCIAAYNGRDGLAYQTNGGFHTSPYDARTLTVYEDNCVVYQSGYRGWAGATSGASDNCSTGHQAINIVRVGGRYYGSDGAVIADVNGSDSANYGVQAGDPGTGGTGNRPWVFWFNANTSEGLNPRMVLIDCSGASSTGEISLVKDGTHATAAIHVQYYQGNPGDDLSGLIKSYPDGAVLNS